MTNLNLKPFFFMLAAFSAVVLFIAALIRGLDLHNFISIVKLVPTVATADGIAYFVFATWLWRWKPLQGWLIPFPDLSGTWLGDLQTDWKDVEGKVPGPIRTMLTIRQSFTWMSCVMRTAEMESHSYLQGLHIDKEAQIRKLCYSYTSVPKIGLRDRSTPHDGTILFRILGKPAQKLEGEYWTQRKTTGTVNLSFFSQDILDQLPEEKLDDSSGEMQTSRGSRK